MNIEKKIAKFFGLNKPEKWLKHANPWSLITRFIILPFLVLAVWARVWIGWYSLIPIVLILIWAKINPIIFHKNIKINNWWTKCVIGEYFWVNRDRVPVPEYHRKIIKILTLLQSLGGGILVFGLYKLHIFLTLIGIISIYFGKMWFLDRMVWIYMDMKNHPEYHKILNEVSA